MCVRVCEYVCKDVRACMYGFVCMCVRVCAYVCMGLCVCG